MHHHRPSSFTAAVSRAAPTRTVTERTLHCPLPLATNAATTSTRSHCHQAGPRGVWRRRGRDAPDRRARQQLHALHTGVLSGGLVLTLTELLSHRSVLQQLTVHCIVRVGEIIGAGRPSMRMQGGKEGKKKRKKAGNQPGILDLQFPDPERQGVYHHTAPSHAEAAADGATVNGCTQ